MANGYEIIDLQNIDVSNGANVPGIYDECEKRYANNTANLFLGVNEAGLELDGFFAPLTIKESIFYAFITIENGKAKYLKIESDDDVSIIYEEIGSGGSGETLLGNVPFTYVDNMYLAQEEYFNAGNGLYMGMLPIGTTPQGFPMFTQTVIKYEKVPSGNVIYNSGNLDVAPRFASVNTTFLTNPVLPSGLYYFEIGTVTGNGCGIFPHMVGGDETPTILEAVLVSQATQERGIYAWQYVIANFESTVKDGLNLVKLEVPYGEYSKETITIPLIVNKTTPFCNALVPYYIPEEYTGAGHTFTQGMHTGYIYKDNLYDVINVLYQ